MLKRRLPCNGCHQFTLIRNSKEFAEDRHENGPQLVSHCESLGEALKCFKENLNDCYNIQHFQEYRQLLDGLSKTYEWLCDEHYLRVRFLVLLKSMNCLETVRMSSSTCSSSAVTQNIWQKILRLETDHEICPVLQWQRDCLLQPNQLTQCGPRADDVYKNMSEIFLESWCNMSPVATHIPVSILIALIFIVQYLVI